MTGEAQNTIDKTISFSGVGLHNGKEVNITLRPADVNTGIIFRRVDLPGNIEIAADPWQVVSTRRCTSIGIKDTEMTVHTIEHMMAAFWGMGIDNLLIDIDGAETPVEDGSAYPFIEILQDAGIKEQERERDIKSIKNPVWVRRGHMYMTILPYDGFKITYTLDYDHPVIGTQFFEFDMDEDSFIDDIAKARTFGFAREVKILHNKGLALGGSLDNAVLIGDDETVNPLRYPDEFVRHKILDLIGDMALNGFIRGHIITVRSGHSLHVELAQEINKKLREEEVDF